MLRTMRCGGVPCNPLLVDLTHPFIVFYRGTRRFDDRS
ncbi:hypothetical protein APS_0806 [Acetobacter pasteurianus subsp. pasteurianus LMG 1262 = NBRC 106471]|nr:hypothetical protein APS_0806 [Acetobacter pasteurianus subsp. pasteurianus LMG 1262 = NBRC 106471]